jgi:hypothetical protein
MHSNPQFLRGDLTVKKIPILLASALSGALCWAEPVSVAPSPNGITRPEGYQDWRVIGVSQRTETGTLRVILGNDVAVRAARSGNTHPWPDGTILTKMAWKQSVHGKFPTAVVPGEFVHTDFMLKDSARFAATGGWGFARWVGDKAAPYGQDANFAQECFGCHGAAKDSDWVFTTPAKLP